MSEHTQLLNLKCIIKDKLLIDLLIKLLKILYLRSFDTVHILYILPKKSLVMVLKW